MKTLILAAIAALTMAVSANAALDWTLDECVAHWGRPDYYSVEYAPSSSVVGVCDYYVWHGNPHVRQVWILRHDWICPANGRVLPAGTVFQELTLY
jgi:hypothetical protein